MGRKQRWRKKKGTEGRKGRGSAQICWVHVYTEITAFWAYVPYVLFYALWLYLMESWLLCLHRWKMCVHNSYVNIYIIVDMS